MNRVLIGLFIASMIFGSSGANACSKPPNWSSQKAFSSAKEIFRAYVTQTTLSPFTDQKYPGSKTPFLVQVSYKLKEVLKGNPRKNGTISTTRFYIGGCGVPVVVGLDYLFFVNAFEPDMATEVMSTSSGMISIFDTVALPSSEKHAEAVIAKVRAQRPKK